MVCRGFSSVEGFTTTPASQVFVFTSGSTTFPSNQETAVGGMASVGESFRRSGISEEVTDFLFKAWDEKTLVAYGRHIKVWNEFCLREQVDPFSPPLSKLMDHLLFLFNEGKMDGSGYSYSSLNAARSAISAVAKINGMPAGQHQMVCFFMRSVAKNRSNLPGGGFTWVPDLLLNTFEAWGSKTQLSLSALSKKVASLLMFLSGQRFQTIDCLDIRNMLLTQDEVILRIGDPLKTSNVRHHLQEIGFSAFPVNVDLCIVDSIRTYIQMTSSLRLRPDQNKLLLTTRKPFGPASKATITR